MEKINETLIRQLVNEALDEIELEKGDNCWEKVKPESNVSPYADGEDTCCGLSHDEVGDEVCASESESDNDVFGAREDEVIEPDGEMSITVVKGPENADFSDGFRELIGNVMDRCEIPCTHDTLEDKASLFDRLMREAKDDYNRWINN